MTVHRPIDGNEVAAPDCAVDRVLERSARLPAHRPLRRVGGHALSSQLLGKMRSPFAQRRLSNVQALSLFALSLDDQVHMRMLLICVQDEGVTMLKRELFPREPPDGFE